MAAQCPDLNLGEPTVMLNLVILINGQKGVSYSVCKQLIRMDGEKPFSMASPV